MTQEEKARAYDEALKKARILVGYPTTQPFISDLQDLFPELSESEDEKIRKEIAVMVNFFYGTNLAFKHSFSKNEMLAWLEKQGEHAKFRDSIQVGDKVTRNQDGVLVNLSQLNRVAKKDEKQGEQKPVELQQDMLSQEKYAKAVDECIYGEQKPYGQREECLDCQMNYAGECKGSCAMKRDEQKPANTEKGVNGNEREIPNSAWSEEDECMLYGVIETEQYMLDVVNGIKKFDVGNGAIRKACTEELNFLKSLKDRVQPQNKWKESLATADLENSLCDIQDGFSDTSYEYIILGEAIEFIRCTEPKPQWKPSDEQIRELSIVATGKGWFSTEILTELLEQLKKLREK